MIRVCAAYGVVAGRIPGLTGAWVRAGEGSTGSGAAEAAAGSSGPAEKIGAIGVRISRWITSHGFAFNVRTDLEFFRLIVPCGIADRGVTSLEREVGAEIQVAEVEARFVQLFGDVFGRRARSIDTSPP